jgi:hypothetical protein
MENTLIHIDGVLKGIIWSLSCMPVDDDGYIKISDEIIDALRNIINVIDNLRETNKNDL